MRGNPYWGKPIRQNIFCNVYKYKLEGYIVLDYFLLKYMIGNHHSLQLIKILRLIEGVRIKTRLSHIFMKNELRVYFIGKPDYASFVYVTIPLHSLVTSYLRHLDVVSAKTFLY